MRHIQEPQILEIPATVAFHPTPCTWLLGEGGQFRVHQIKSSGHSKLHTATSDSPAVTFPDAWSVRSTFLALKDEHVFLDFLNQTGLFFRDGAYDGDQTWRLTDFAVWQRVLIGFLRRRPPAW